MVVWTMKAVETGGGTYYVLCDKAGYPVAQGRQALVECIHDSLLRGDTPEQQWDRIRFRGLDLPDRDRTPRFK